jgi:chromosome segregation ATPase
MNGVVRGVPEALVPHILGFWTAALTEVRAEFAAQVTDWQARIERVEAAAAHAEAEREQAIHHADTLQAQIEGLQAAQATLQGRVETEQAAREQAERMFDANRQELAEQRDALRAALAHSQKELSAAITRLEGGETHALREVTRARTEAQEKIAGIEAKASREKDEHTIEMARLNNQLRDLRRELAEASQAAAVQEQAKASLRERLQRAEMQADRLASENAQLVASLQQAAAAAPRQPLRRKTPVRKKRSPRVS